MQGGSSNAGEFSGAPSPSVRRVARQLITEYGEQAGTMARRKIELSSSEEEARQWRLVLDAVTSLSPGQPSTR